MLGSQAYWLYASLGRAGVVHFLALLPPTCLMGMSLPFLSQAAVQDLRIACRTIGVLYGLNILGAALGALLTPWFFIRYWGIDGAVLMGAGANFTAGLCALLLGVIRIKSTAVPASVSVVPASTSTARASTVPQLGFRLWMLLYGLSGFIALALEILWFRLIDVAVRSTAFTFGSVLAIYLLGLGIGCLYGGRWALRVKSPLRAFLLCQTALQIYTGVSIWLLIHLPTDFPGYAALYRYWNSADVFALGEEWDPLRIGMLYLLLPAVLYGPPTILMGMSFAVLQRAVHDDTAATGRRVGYLQAANIIGNVAGSLLVGVVLLNWLGTAESLRVLLAVGVIFPVLGWRWLRGDRAFAFGLAAQLGVVLAIPSTDALWSRLHGIPAGRGLFTEDASGLMAITPALEEGGALRVSMNGKWQSWLPFGGIHSELGAVAAVLHPKPLDVAIIGLGSGDTAWAAACRSETERVVVYEICAAEEDLLREISVEISDLRTFLADPRIDIVADDGRRSLARSDKHFDLIEADALRPQSGYAGNIYSVEFFQLCAARLKPGGLMCQWGPTPRTYRSFRAAFPHVVEVPGRRILIGSNDPISLDPSGWQTVLDRSDVRRYVGEINYRGLTDCLSTARPLPPDEDADRSLNHDLFPRDEFATP